MNKSLWNRIGILLAGSLLLPCTLSQGVSEYYSLSRSIRALGMGGAFYGLSNDENAVFYNPAGLGFYEGGKDFMISLKLDGSTSVASAFTTLTKPGTRTIASTITDLQRFAGDPIHAGVTPLYMYYLRKYFSVGLLLADTKANLAILGADLDTTADFTAISDTGLFAGFAYPILPGLMIGATVKNVLRIGGQKTYTVLEIAQNQGLPTDIASLGGAGVAVDFDLGVTYQLPKIVPGLIHRVSLVANNLMAGPFKIIQLNGSASGAPPGLPRMLTLAGMTRLPGFGAVNRIDLLLDIAELGLGGESNPDYGARSGNIWKHLNFGAEAMLWGCLFGRIGVHQGNFTLGAGIDARYFQLDLATYAEEMGALPGRLTSRRVALRLAVGLGGAKPAVAAATSASIPEPEGNSKAGATADMNSVPEQPSKSLEPGPSTAPTQPNSQNEDLGLKRITTVSFRQ